MSKLDYSGETKTSKKVELSNHLVTINTALDNINKVDSSIDWSCIKGDELSTNLNDLKAKIPGIKEALQTYIDFLGVVDSTYEGINSDINSVFSGKN
jgi:hypothetical protein